MRLWNMKNPLLAILVVGSGYLIPQAAHAVIVDTTLTNTSQIRTASNNPYFGATTTANLAAINLYFTNQVASGTSLNGVFFDNINMGSPPTSTQNVTSNQPGITLNVSTPGSRDNTARSGSTSATGTDLAVLTKVVQDISYIANTGGNLQDTFTFGGLGANRQVYVQTIGASQWGGTPVVKANGITIGNWTSNPIGVASVYGFDTTTDASGNLALDYTIGSGNFAGIAGIIITGQVPEPSSLGLLAMGGLVLVRRQRKH